MVVVLIVAALSAANSAILAGAMTDESTALAAREIIWGSDNIFKSYGV